MDLDFLKSRMTSSMFRLTPFQYYIMVLENIMGQEKSYDSLPNFTAVDCLRYRYRYHTGI